MCETGVMPMERVRGRCRVYDEVRFDPAMVAAATAGNEHAVDDLVVACLPYAGPLKVDWNG